MLFKNNRPVKKSARIDSAYRTGERPSISDSLGEILRNILGNDSVKIARKSIQRRLKDELSRYTGLDPECILIFAQPDTALETIVDIYISEGSQAVIPGPSETSLFRAVEMSDGTVRECFGESPFLIDLDSIAAAINDKTSILFISNPSRPAGAVYGLHELETLLNQSHDFLMVIDEYEFEISGINCTELIRKYKNLAVIRKFPRLLGLASTSAEYLLAAPEIIREIEKRQRAFEYSGLSGTAALAALRSLAFVRSEDRMIKENMILMDTRLRGMGFDSQKTPFDYILVKFSDPDMAAAYLISRGVSCRSLSSFNQLENYLAVSISSEEGVSAAIEALANIPEKLRDKGLTYGSNNTE